jgi:hypothetical protein
VPKSAAPYDFHVPIASSSIFDVEIVRFEPWEVSVKRKDVHVQTTSSNVLATFHFNLTIRFKINSDSLNELPKFVPTRKEIDEGV